MPTATGNAVAVALGLERSGWPGVAGDLTLTQYSPILPVSMGMLPAEAESGQVNSSGYVVAGIPTDKTGAVEVNLPMTTAQLLEFWEHITGQCTKSTAATSAYSYTFTPPALASYTETSFAGLVAREPIDRQYAYGIKFDSIELAIADGAVIPVKLTGAQMHGTYLGAPVAAVANTGTYALGPWLRGNVAVPKAVTDERLTVEVTTVTPLTFKTFWGGATPTFSGSAHSVPVDADGEALWQIFYDETGADVGAYAENKDPVEIIWPGLQAQHNDLVIGDQFHFPLSWSLPSLSQATTATRLTRAHWEIQWRPATGGTYAELRCDTGAVKIENPLSVRYGNNSRYPFEILREGPIRPTATFSRAFVDTNLRDKFERHGRLDLVLTFAAEQVGDLTAREGTVFELPSAGITGNGAPIAGGGVIVETTEVVGETDSSGNPPLVITATSARNWTPATAP